MNSQRYLRANRHFKFYLVTCSLSLDRFYKVRHYKHGIVFVWWNRVIGCVEYSIVLSIVDWKSAAHVFILNTAQAFDLCGHNACWSVCCLISFIIDNVDSLK